VPLSPSPTALAEAYAAFDMWCAEWQAQHDPDLPQQANMRELKNQRRWRVSVYKPGTTDLSTFPLFHKASRECKRAKEYFRMFARQIGKGTVGRVVLHQGLLYRGSNHVILHDTAWFKASYPDHLLDAEGT